MANENCSPTGYACRTQTIYSALSSPEAGFDLKILCGNQDQTGEVLYRNIATSTSSSSSSTSSSSTTSPTTPSAASPSVVNGVVHPSSKAWIAGVVIGPLVGLAIIAGLVWFFLRRRRGKEHGAPIENGSPAAPQSTVEYKTVPMEENAAVVEEKRMSELPGNYGHSSFQPSELEDNSHQKR